MLVNKKALIKNMHAQLNMITFGHYIVKLRCHKRPAAKVLTLGRYIVKLKYHKRSAVKVLKYYDAKWIVHVPCEYDYIVSKIA